MRKGSDEPTEFGYYLIRKMAEHDPPLSQAGLARLSGVGQATISRWIFKPQRPEAEKLRLLSPVLDAPYEELLAVAGYGEPTKELTEALTALRPDIDPLAAELSAMLNESSPLSDTDREVLRTLVDRVIDMHRRTMRGRRSA